MERLSIDPSFDLSVCGKVWRGDYGRIVLLMESKRTAKTPKTCDVDVDVGDGDVWTNFEEDEHLLLFHAKKKKKGTQSQSTWCHCSDT